MNVVDLKCESCGATLEKVEHKQTEYLCPYCGHKMIVETTYDQEFAKIQASHDFNLQQEKEEVKNILNYNRVESLSGKDANRTVFDIYGRLVEPTKKYEQDFAALVAAKTRRENLKMNFVPHILIYIVLTVVLIVLFFIGQLFIPKSSMRSFSKEFSQLSDSEKEIYLGDYRVYACSKDYINCFFSPFSMDVYGREDFSDVKAPEGTPQKLDMLYVNQGELWVNLIRPAIVGAYIYGAIYIITVIYSIIASVFNKKKIRFLEERTEKMKQELSKLIVYCPPKYRTAEALAFFYNSFNNSRCDNLKEAINLYMSGSKEISEITNGLDLLREDVIDSEGEERELKNVLETFNYSLFS